MTTSLRWTLDPRSTLALAVAATLLVTVGLTALWQARAFRRATLGVRHTLFTMHGVERVTRRLVDAESAERGFVLSGRAEHLEALSRTRADLPRDLDALATLVAADPALDADVAGLRPLVTERLAALDRTVELRRRGGLEAALAAVETDTGRRSMGELQRRLDELSDQLRRLLDARRATTNGRNARLLAVLGIANGLAFALVIGGAWVLNGEARRRLAVQARLAESQDRLRVTLRSIGDAVIATDADGRVVFMNPVAELLTGWTSADAHGRPLAEVFVIVNEATRAAVESPVARVLREGITVGLANHTVLFARDGREIPIDDSAAPIRDADRRLMGVVLVFRDVTERRRLELEAAHAARLAAERLEAERHAEALRASEERYRSLVAAATDVVWTAGATGTFDEPQPGWEAYTGQRWPQDAGRGWLAAVHPDDRATMLQLWEAAQLARTVLEVEGRVWHALSGEYHHCRARGVPLVGVDGALRQWVGMIEDVHARRQAELQNEDLLRIAERARVEAETANQAKDEFLAVLSHELRSPLQTMLAWVAVLRETGPPTPETARALDALTGGIRTQQQLVNDLLDVSRIVTGTFVVARAPFDVAATVRACLDDRAADVAAKGLALEHHGLDAVRVVVGDAARLAQALRHLLRNAIEFTPAGGRIEVLVGACDGRHEIRVRDTGEGLTSEALAHVFDRFWQADSAKTRRHGGLGLGLAIARYAVEAQGGTLDAASAGPGHGATFTVRLPAADGAAGTDGAGAAAVGAGTAGVADDRARETDDAAAPSTGTPASAPPGPPAGRTAASAPASAPGGPPSSPPALAGVRVLLVEDDEAMSEAMAALLEHHGATVTTAASVATALGLLDTAAPDVLVSDVGMPGESGYALIREVRAREAAGGGRLPALAMTGFASPDDRDDARAAGFDEHLPKPVDPEILLRRIRELVGGGPA